MERLTKKNGNSYEKAKTYITHQQLVDKLADYEDAEEQGLLLRLPCKVGDTVYSVVADGRQIIELRFCLEFYVVRKNDFGKTVFLTREEAEKALADMKGE